MEQYLLPPTERMTGAELYEQLKPHLAPNMPPELRQNLEDALNRCDVLNARSRQHRPHDGYVMPLGRGDILNKRGPSTASIYGIRLRRISPLTVRMN